MIDFIHNITSEVTTLWQTLLGLCIIVGTIALGLFLIVGAISRNNARVEALKNVAMVVVALAGIGALTSLVSWAVGIGV